MKNVEEYRSRIVDDLFKTKTFNTAWTIWEPQILSLTNNLTDARRVYELGQHLTTIFTTTAQSGRGQEVLSAAGNVWESLVCWYLNLVFSGSRAVAMKQKKALVPECISDCAMINYGSDQTNTESDLIVIVFPDSFSFPPLGVKFSDLSALIEPKIATFELGVIQCKTNWNDNAQVPMLWDMIYRAKGFNDHSISIGRNGSSIYDLRKFTYSFVTVPTQKDPYKATDMAVKRVRNLSGGNYWGKPSQNGVAMNVCEIFNRNFRSAFDKAILASISEAITAKSGVFGRH